MDELISTTKVAERLGVSTKTMWAMLIRHPELKPAMKIEPSGTLLWTEAEIAKVIEFRQNPNKGGRPPKSTEERHD